MKNGQCLLLNASFEPMRTISMEDAMRLLAKERIEVVEFDESQPIRTINGPVGRPAVVRLKKFIRVPHAFRRKVTNTFMFARDQYTCQYCGRHESELRGRESLNRDHVQPQSRGGDNTWENCVTSCSTCNSKKDNQTPQEAGMTLRSIPTVPHLVLLKWKVRKLTDLHRKYISMFYGDSWLEAME